MSDRTRVLRIVARLNVGGPALHTTLLTERLDPSRYDSLLVTGIEDAREGNFLTLQGKRLERQLVLPALGREIRAASDARTLLDLVRLMRRWRPDIVHTHAAKAGALGRLAARLAEVPVVVHTYHGHVFRGYFSPAKTRLFLAIDRWLGRRTSRVLTVSEAVRDELLALGVGSPDRVDVMPPGLDLAHLVASEARRGELRAELGVDADAPLVGIVARLVPIKAHELFFEAAARIARRVPDARFLVVGDGVLRPALEALVRSAGLADRVRFLGWRRDLDRIYADLDVVVLSSRNEGSPVSLIEAMASGKPVVATRVGGVADLVEDRVSGRLVSSGDAGAMADAVLDLLAEPERRRAMGAAGRKRVVPAFGAERLIADMDALYQELLRQAEGR